MATHTKNLNLVKPDVNDPVSLVPFNNNADIIDEKLSSALGAMGNKWEFIKSYIISVNKSSILIPKTDIYDFYKYDEILLCFSNGNISVTSTSSASPYYVGIVSDEHGSTTYRMYQFNKIDNSSIYTGYAACPDIMVNFVTYKCDPLNGTKIYRTDRPVSEPASEGSRFVELNEKYDFLIKTSYATYEGNLKVYGRAWAFPGD